jgi:predicted O-methyltransferase YrrM
MDDARFAEVDRWIARHLLPDDPVLEAVLHAGRTAGLPEIDVSPLLGALLGVLAHAVNARRILEIGTLGGYSAIWMARALPPDGRLVTLEANPRHAEVARANVARADLAKRIDIRVGAALDLLPGLVDEGHAFDLAFIDADKENNAAYADWAATLVRPGGLVVVDNVVRAGRIADPADTSPPIEGTRSLYAAMRMDSRFEASALQTVGVKGWDGILIARRR